MAGFVKDTPPASARSGRAALLLIKPGANMGALTCVKPSREALSTLALIAMTGEAMYKRILVPIDGSDTAARGLAEAIALARELKATVRLLNLTSDFVLMVEMSNVIDYEKFREGLNQVGRRLLAQASELAKAQGVTAETSLHDLRGGRVADAIVEEARQSRCDLIVIGTHGRRGVARAMLGSDAENVVRSSPVPVLLVRAPAPVS